MSYQLNKTDGTLLIDLIDGQLDTNSTNLTLVGRNYSGYGEAFNENFIKLLENFANTAAPSNPLTGQTWWDTNAQRLKVYDGSVWKASGGPFVQDTRPQMVAGDLWIDNLNNQVYAYDGTDTILIGPQYTESQGKSGFEIGSILDSQSRSRTVVYLYIGGTLAGLYSNLEFTPIYAQRIAGLITDTNPNSIIYEGFNVINKATFKFLGIAESANALVTAGGTVRTADSFLPSTANGITTGTLTIQNSGGLTIGTSQNNVQKVIGSRFYIENQLRDHDISLRVRSSAYESVIVDGIYIDASAARVGIFTTNRLPEYTLDVEGDLRVTGDLIVEGDATRVEVAILQVEDKNIELGYINDSTGANDVLADGGGITLLSSDGNKTINWINATNSWTSNQIFNLSTSSLTYNIGGSVKLTNTSLTNITKALDLNEIGTLISLQVDEINVNGKTISSTNDLRITSTAGIAIVANGDISVDSHKITGVSNPTNAQDVATKIYTDTEIANETIVFSMDITGLGSGTVLQNAVALYLQDLYPASALAFGKIAKIHTTSYAGATVSGIPVTVTIAPNNTGTLTKSYISVDANGTLNEPVVQDIVASNTTSGAIVLTPTRALMTYAASSTSWIHQATVAYP